jgi:hypothetical protein
MTQEALVQLWQKCLSNEGIFGYMRLPVRLHNIGDVLYMLNGMERYCGKLKHVLSYI